MLTDNYLTPANDAALIAFQILIHNGSLPFGPSTVRFLTNIRERGERSASPDEWAKLRACYDAVLRAERGGA